MTYEKIGTSQRLNLAGHRFGNLVAIEYVEGSSPPLWKCQCDCGNTVNVISNFLTRKKKTSCGCHASQKQLRSDLSGMRFGNLTVLERAENYISPKGQSQIRYLCQCDCGNQKVIHASALKKGSTLSCGCMTSVGENRIAKYLKSHNIEFQSQIRFSDCRDQRPLPFDFGIFKDGKLLFLIEVNGQQHYEPKFGSTPEKAQAMLEYIQKHDAIKTEYCQEYSIDLLVIPYQEIGNYEFILKERLKDYYDL